MAKLIDMSSEFTLPLLVLQFISRFLYLLLNFFLKWAPEKYDLLRICGNIAESRARYPPPPNKK